MYSCPTSPGVHILIAACTAGAVASVSEAVSPGDLDNIVNPVLVAISMVLLGL